MATIRFPPGNKILYMQDFRMWEGIPSWVEFEVEILKPREGEMYGDRVRLTAPGYGAKTPYYGNGALYLSRGILFDKQLDCLNCKKIAPINEMYSVDACCEKCQEALV